MSTGLVLADQTVDVFFKDEKWVLWQNDSGHTTAEQLECCEWYEWVDGEWKMRRQSGMSCLGLGITVLSNEREVLNPIFSEPPLAPENGPLDNNDEAYNTLISDGRFEGTAFPRTVSCNAFLKRCAEGDCGDGGPGKCADGSDCNEITMQST